MGIVCQIFIHQSQGYFKPGDTVTGVIRYTLDEPTKFREITISLKGKGKTVLKKSQGIGSQTYTDNEVYIDLDYVNLKEEATISNGSYEIPFSFLLPKNVPASIDINTYCDPHKVTCTIKYYIRIKFEKPELFSLTKRFKKEITVLPTMSPRLPMEPKSFTKTANLIKFSSCSISNVRITAVVKSCVIKPEGIIEVDVEIRNDSHVDLNFIECRLKRKYIYKAGKAATESENLYDSIKDHVPKGVTKNVTVEINVPKYEVSLEHSRLIKREYYFIVTAGTPFPYFNIKLKIPIQIGEFYECNTASTAPAAMLPNYTDNPPSYWEAMGEDDEK